MTERRLLDLAYPHYTMVQLYEINHGERYEIVTSNEPLNLKKTYHFKSQEIAEAKFQNLAQELNLNDLTN